MEGLSGMGNLLGWHTQGVTEEMRKCFKIIGIVEKSFEHFLLWLFKHRSSNKVSSLEIQISLTSIFDSPQRGDGSPTSAFLLPLLAA